MKNNMSIMIVDDEMVVRESFYHWFKQSGYRIDTAENGMEALKKMEQNHIDVMFVDIKMPKMSGIELLEKIKQEYPETIVVIITAFGSIETAVQAMKMGAADYLLKPFKPEQLNLVMEKIIQQQKVSAEFNYLKSRLNQITRFENIIGQSPVMKKLFDIIQEVAISDATILILGETGTGKELVAKAIHAKSNRNQCPFVAINCGTIPDSLMASELFGHQKGAFTGASNTRKGFLEVVSGGTLFLDEVGEISSKMQVDLLRVLEDKKIVRVGNSYPVDVDFRLISATRRNLKKQMERNLFRADFFYRINVVTIEIPPLRERKDDIPLLADHFLKKYSGETKKQIDRFSKNTMTRLLGYDWPGNVRELENAIERAVVVSKKKALSTEDFPFLEATKTGQTKQLSLLESEKACLCQALETAGWNVTQAAKLLDINRVTLHKKIKRYNLKRAEH